MRVSVGVAGADMRDLSMLEVVVAIARVSVGVAGADMRDMTMLRSLGEGIASTKAVESSGKDEDGTRERENTAGMIAVRSVTSDLRRRLSRWTKLLVGSIVMDARWQCACVDLTTRYCRDGMNEESDA